MHLNIRHRCKRTVGWCIGGLHHHIWRRVGSTHTHRCPCRRGPAASISSRSNARSGRHALLGARRRRGGLPRRAGGSRRWRWRGRRGRGWGREGRRWPDRWRGQHPRQRAGTPCGCPWWRRHCGRCHRRRVGARRSRGCWRSDATRRRRPRARGRGRCRGPAGPPLGQACHTPGPRFPHDFELAQAQGDEAPGLIGASRRHAPQAPVLGRGPMKECAPQRRLHGAERLASMAVAGQARHDDALQAVPIQGHRHGSVPAGQHQVVALAHGAEHARHVMHRAEEVADEPPLERPALLHIQHVVACKDWPRASRGGRRLHQVAQGFAVRICQRGRHGGGASRPTPRGRLQQYISLDAQVLVLWRIWIDLQDNPRQC